MFRRSVMGRRNITEKVKEPKKDVQTGGKSALILDIVLILLGVTFIIWAEKALDLMTRIVGVCLVGIFVAEIVIFIKSRTREMWEKVGLGVSVILAVLGLWLAISPGSFHGLINYVFGFLILVYGAFGIVNSVSFARASGGLWWIGLIMSISAVAMAILILLNPSFLAGILMIAIGIAIVFSGVTGIYNWVNVRKAQKMAMNDPVIINVSDMKDAGSDEE